jgi:hypothetical protein
MSSDSCLNRGRVELGLRGSKRVCVQVVGGFVQALNGLNSTSRILSHIPVTMVIESE